METSCKSATNANTDPDQLLAELKLGKKQMLESSVYALQEGEALLEKLENLWRMASMDSRPDFWRPSIARAIGKVAPLNFFSH